MPFFSIVIPCYNREARIAHAIESVLKQTFTDFEIVVVDDASKDKSISVVQSFDDPRIKLLKNSKNLERSVSRNKGIDVAAGKYICFLDSDDYHLEEHLEKLHQLIVSKNEKGFYFSNAWNESEVGDRSERHCPDFKNFDPYTYFLRYTVNPQRWAVHRDLLKLIRFDPKVVICEDMDVSLRIASAGYPIHHLNEQTTVYVAASDSFTHGDTQKWQKELFYLQKIFEKPELKRKLPRKERKRLLSRCHYHLAIYESEKGFSWRLYRHLVMSFIQYPKGYNGNNNFPMLVMAIYGLPILGLLIQFVNRKRKNS